MRDDKFKYPPIRLLVYTYSGMKSLEDRLWKVNNVYHKP